MATLLRFCRDGMPITDGIKLRATRVRTGGWSHYMLVHVERGVAGVSETHFGWLESHGPVITDSRWSYQEAES